MDALNTLPGEGIVATAEMALGRRPSSSAMQSTWVRMRAEVWVNQLFSGSNLFTWLGECAASPAGVWFNTIPWRFRSTPTRHRPITREVAISTRTRECWCSHRSGVYRPCLMRVVQSWCSVPQVFRFNASVDTAVVSGLGSVGFLILRGLLPLISRGYTSGAKKDSPSSTQPGSLFFVE